jgi:hypothetical protein
MYPVTNYELTNVRLADFRQAGQDQIARAHNQ